MGERLDAMVRAIDEAVREWERHAGTGDVHALADLRDDLCVTIRDLAVEVDDLTARLEATEEEVLRGQDRADEAERGAADLRDELAAIEAAAPPCPECGHPLDPGGVCRSYHCGRYGDAAVAS